MEWLKTVKESHGSVERSSLTLARAINSRGIYVIQAPAGGQKVSGRIPAPLAGARGGGSSLSRKPPYMSTAPQISPDTVLRLTLPESREGGEERRDYSLEELKELLNKLMLMSGKKDHSGSEAEVFSEVGVLLPRAWELWGQRRPGWDWGAHC